MRFCKITPEILKQTPEHFERYYGDYNEGYDTGLFQTNDCAVIALTHLCDMTWQEAYTNLARRGREMYLIMDHIDVIRSVLKDHGYEWHNIEDGKQTIAQFANSHPQGKFGVFCYEHIVAVVDGTLYDQRNTGRMQVIGYFAKRKTVLDRV